MPLYEYKCTKCGYATEVIQKVNDEPLSKCIKCGGLVKRVLSAPALQFKGSGWYITDYKQKGKKEEKPKKKEKKTEEKKKAPSSAK